MFLALCLIGGNFAGITAMIAQSAAPKLHLLLFLTMWTFLIGVGSACTGWIFIAVEQERRRSR